MSNFIIFDLFCEDERQFTPHKIIEDKQKNIQTISCLTCGHTRTDAMVRRVGINMNIKESIAKVIKDGRE